MNLLSLSDILSALEKCGKGNDEVLVEIDGEIQLQRVRGVSVYDNQIVIVAEIQE